MHFYEALEKTQPKKEPEAADPALAGVTQQDLKEPEAADPAPAGVTHQDLKDVMKAFQDALSSNNESMKKEIMEMIKNSNASQDVNNDKLNNEERGNNNEC